MNARRETNKTAVLQLLVALKRMRDINPLFHLAVMVFMNAYIDCPKTDIIITLSRRKYLSKQITAAFVVQPEYLPRF